MQTRFKKRLIAAAMAGVIFTSTVAMPRRAHALFSAASYGQLTSVLLFSGACAGAAAGGISLVVRAWRSSGIEAFSLYVMGALSIFGAAILLDGHAQASGEFLPLDEERAGAIGLTTTEWAAYENELPLINALREETLLETQKAYPNPEQVSDQALLDHVRDEWKNLTEGVLSVESFKAVEKISAAQIRRLQNR